MFLSWFGCLVKIMELEVTNINACLFHLKALTQIFMSLAPSLYPTKLTNQPCFQGDIYQKENKKILSEAYFSDWPVETTWLMLTSTRYSLRNSKSRWSKFPQYLPWKFLKNHSSDEAITEAFDLQHARILPQIEGKGGWRATDFHNYVKYATSGREDLELQSTEQVGSFPDNENRPYLFCYIHRSWLDKHPSQVLNIMVFSKGRWQKK